MSFASISKYFSHQTIPVLKIQGRVEQLLVNNIQSQLNQINKSTVQALALVINSTGGCPYAVDTLSNKITAYANENHLPIYTFAAESALEGGYKLLSVGNHTYAQPTSKIGFTSQQHQQFKWNALLSHYGINTTLMTTNPLLSQYIYNGPNDQANQDNANLELTTTSDMITQDCLDLRKNCTVKKDDLKQSIYFGQQAKELGLVDHLGTYEDILMKNYPNAKLVSLSKESRLKAYEDYFNLFIKITQSRGFIGLLILFGLKVIIKWTLIISVWLKVRKQKKLNKQQKQQ